MEPPKVEKREEWDYVFIPTEPTKEFADKKPVVFAARSFKISTTATTEASINKVEQEYQLKWKAEDERKKVMKYEQNAVRWKNKGPEIVSNARLIEWSDGTYQIAIGDQLFDLADQKMPNTAAFSAYQTEKDYFLIPQEPVDSRLTLKFTH